MKAQQNKDQKQKLDSLLAGGGGSKSPVGGVDSELRAALARRGGATK
jgi:hypothetical protein